MLQHSKKRPNGRQFLECESEAVAFATTPVTPVNFSHNPVRYPYLRQAPPPFAPLTVTIPFPSKLGGTF